MPINRLNFLSFDFETGGLKPGYHEAIQIGAKVYGPNFKPIGGESGEFVSLMKPLHFDRLDQEALAINGKTVEMLEGAPDQGVVWKSFIKWADQWKAKGGSGGNGASTRPIAVGKNIRDFDLHFVDELNKLHAPKGIEQKIFHNKRLIDLEDIMFHWFGFSEELQNYKMDDFRVYLGMTQDNAHDALVDARQTGDVVMRFLQWYKHLFNKVNKYPDGTEKKFIEFRGSFASKR